MVPIPPVSPGGQVSGLPNSKLLQVADEGEGQSGIRQVICRDRLEFCKADMLSGETVK